MKQTKKFIKLHLVNQNQPIIINTEMINDIYQDVKEKRTEITFINENTNVYVLEKVDKIYDMIYSEE